MVTKGSSATMRGMAPLFALVMYMYRDDVLLSFRSLQLRISHWSENLDGCLTLNTYGTF